jgi:hypothetical protein
MTLKMSYLNEELIDSEAAVDKGKWEMNLSVLEIFAQMGIAIPATSQPNQNPVLNENPETASDDRVEFKDDSPDIGPAFKNLQKKIARQTHPDRYVQSPDDVKQEMEDIFKEAMQAANDGDTGKLVEIAVRLNIEFDEDDEHILDAVKKSAAAVEVKINALQRTPQYAWSINAKNLDVRGAMLDAVLKSMGHNVGQNVIMHVLEWVAGGCQGGTKYVDPDKTMRTPPIPKRRPGERPAKLPKR